MKKLLILILLFPTFLFSQNTVYKNLGTNTKTENLKITGQVILGDSSAIAIQSDGDTLSTNPWVRQEISDSLATITGGSPLKNAKQYGIPFLGNTTLDTFYIDSTNLRFIQNVVTLYAKNMQTEQLQVDSIFWGNNYNDYWTYGKMQMGPDSTFLEVRNKFPDFIHNIGGELVIKVINKSGSLIPNATPVRFMGATGDHPNIVLASNSTRDSAAVVGVTTFDIANNKEGLITIDGQLSENLSAYSLGDTLWLGIGGQLTNVMPSLPYVAFKIGNVTKAGAGGRITLDMRETFANFETNGVVFKGDNGNFQTDSTNINYKKSIKTFFAKIFKTEKAEIDTILIGNDTLTQVVDFGSVVFEKGLFDTLITNGYEDTATRLWENSADTMVTEYARVTDSLFLGSNTVKLYEKSTGGIGVKVDNSEKLSITSDTTFINNVLNAESIKVTDTIESATGKFGRVLLEDEGSYIDGNVWNIVGGGNIGYIKNNGINAMSIYSGGEVRFNSVRPLTGSPIIIRSSISSEGNGGFYIDQGSGSPNLTYSFYNNRNSGLGTNATNDIYLATNSTQRLRVTDDTTFSYNVISTDNLLANDSITINTTKIYASPSVINFKTPSQLFNLSTGTSNIGQNLTFNATGSSTITSTFGQMTFRAASTDVYDYNTFGLRLYSGKYIGDLTGNTNIRFTSSVINLSTGNNVRVSVEDDTTFVNNVLKPNSIFIEKLEADTFKTTNGSYITNQFSQDMRIVSKSGTAIQLTTVAKFNTPATGDSNSPYVAFQKNINGSTNIAYAFTEENDGGLSRSTTVGQPIVITKLGVEKIRAYTDSITLRPKDNNIVFSATKDTIFNRTNVKIDSTLKTGNPKFYASFSDSSKTLDLTQNVFVQLNGDLFTENRNRGGFTFQGDSLKIPKTGWYTTDVRLSFQGGSVTAATYNVHIFVNNTEITNKGSFERTTTSTNKGAASLFLNYYFTKNDWIKIMIKNESNNNDINMNTGDWYVSWDE